MIYTTQCQNAICKNNINPIKTAFCSNECRESFYKTIKYRVGPYAIPYEIKCKCPNCGKIFIILMNWIGNGMPRIFCSDCKKPMMKKANELESTINPVKYYNNLNNRAVNL